MNPYIRQAQLDFKMNAPSTAEIKRVLDYLATREKGCDLQTICSPFLEEWQIGTPSGSSYGYMLDQEDAYIVGTILAEVRLIRSLSHEVYDRRREEARNFDANRKKAWELLEAHQNRPKRSIPNNWTVHTRGKP